MAKRAPRKTSARSTQTPKSNARIGRKGPPIARVIGPPSKSRRVVDYLAIDANPQDWFRVMRRADTGDTGPQIDMFADARVRDPHLSGVISKRVQSMMGRPIAFRPADGLETNKRALQVARDVRRILLFESQQFRSMLVHLMTGAAYGYSVSPIRWRTNADGEHVPHLEWVHLNRFGFTQDTREIGFYEGGDYRSGRNIVPLSNYPDAFVAHIPMAGNSDYPWRRGAVRSCIIPSFIKRNGLQFWLTLAERFGMPQPYAKVPDGLDHDGKSSDDTVAMVEEALANLSSTWSMVVSDAITIESIDGSGNVSADVHKALIDWADTTQSIAMLGQNLTTKVSGGSFAAAESHRYVAGDIHLADATELGETITQQLVEPIVRYNWPGEPVPICEISTGQKQVFTTEHVNAGIASPDELRRTLGHEAIPDGAGSEYRRPVTVDVPADLEPTSPEPSEAPEPEEPKAGDAIDVVSDEPTEAVAKDPQASLNGAQVDALKGIVSDVALGRIPRETGIELIVAAFPLSQAQADKIMGTVGNGFEPVQE